MILLQPGASRSRDVALLWFALYTHRVHRPIRYLQALLGYALAALLLAGPAAAWSTHDLAHVSSPVAADTHHHHDAAGSVEQHEVADEDAGADDRHTTLPGEDGDGGHDHMPSLSAGLSAMVASAPVLAAPPVTRVEHASPTVLVPPDNIRLPHIRPPRAA